MLKEIKDDTSKWKDILCLWTWRLNILRLLFKVIYKFNAIHIKIHLFSHISPHFKTYCKPLVITTAWLWYKNRHTNQGEQNKSPDVNSCMYGQIIFNMGIKIIQWGKYNLFKKKMLGKLHSMCKKWNWTLTLHHMQKLNANGSTV